MLEDLLYMGCRDGHRSRKWRLTCFAKDRFVPVQDTLLERPLFSWKLEVHAWNSPPVKFPTDGEKHVHGPKSKADQVRRRQPVYRALLWYVLMLWPQALSGEKPRFELKNTSPVDTSADRYTVAMGRVETRSLRTELLEIVPR
jgi:hypothetical protein